LAGGQIVRSRVAITKSNEPRLGQANEESSFGRCNRPGTSLEGALALKSGHQHYYGFRRGAVNYFTHSDDLWDEDVKVDQAGYLTDLLGAAPST
jgi:hypothetical protein